MNNTLATATTSHVAAEKALDAAMATRAPRDVIQTAWDAAKEARHAYATALDAEGHLVPIGLLWDK